VALWFGRVGKEHTFNHMKSVVWSGGQIVLVIDALDDCGSNKHRKELLPALSKGFRNLPSFIRIMMVSRQESDILGSHSAVYRYSLGIDSVVNRNSYYIA
jgi:hypothetical protein